MIIMFSKEQNKKLCERYPFLLPRNVFSDKLEKDYDYSYIKGIGEIPKGWNKLFLQCCEDIRKPLIEANYLDKFRISTIKEKYNTLRIYHFGATEEVQNILMMYEYVSEFVCTVCGRPATKETNGWIYGYCDECFEKQDSRDFIKKEFTPIFTITKYSMGKEEELQFDCSDIWNRLYS